MHKFGRGYQKRKINTLIPRKKFLIVCEGERTEPNYFMALKDVVAKGVLFLRIEGTGYNTVSLIKEAIRLRSEESKKGTDFDHVWAVFDKDDFSNEQFNEAIRLANENDIKTAYSNQAFELWYLLHFAYIDAALHRDIYIKKLGEKLGKGYQKNDPNIYGDLQRLGNEEHAINYANKLNESYDHTSPAIENPSTTVHILVKELNAFKTK